MCCIGVDKCIEAKSQNGRFVERVTNDEIQHCFEQFKACLQRYKEKGGQNIEASCNFVCYRSEFSHQSRYFTATPRLRGRLVFSAVFRHFRFTLDVHF